MKMLPTGEIVKALADLNVQRMQVIRAVDAGKLRYMMLGVRKRLIDLDEARAYFEKVQKSGVGIDALSTETGLKKCAIRRGMRDGWLPYWRGERGGIRYDVSAVYAAIEARMRGNEK